MTLLQLAIILAVIWIVSGALTNWIFYGKFNATQEDNDKLIKLITDSFNNKTNNEEE